jgi:hypothetical protein
MPMAVEILIALGLLGLLLAALELGYRFGFRVTRSDAADARAGGGGQIGTVQAAVLGLLGLLLGFSFAGAAARFIERQDLITVESNAIGTAYLRADLLDEPYKSELRAALKTYTEHRLEVSQRLRTGIDVADLAAVDELHGRIWKAASAGVSAKPDMMLGVLPPVNDVIDVHATRLNAGRKHLPTLVMGLLVACSAIALAMIGYGCGVGARRRAPLTVPLALLIGTTLWITIDFDHPRGGLMQLNDTPLRTLRFE